MHGNFVGLKIQPDLRICLITYTTDTASKTLAMDKEDVDGVVVVIM